LLRRSRNASVAFLRKISLTFLFLMVSLI